MLLKQAKGKGSKGGGSRGSRGGSRAFSVKKARRALDNEFVRLLMCQMSTVVLYFDMQIYVSYKNNHMFINS